MTDIKIYLRRDNDTVGRYSAKISPRYGSLVFSYPWGKGVMVGNYFNVMMVDESYSLALSRWYEPNRLRYIVRKTKDVNRINRILREYGYEIAGYIE